MKRDIISGSVTLLMWLYLDYGGQQIVLVSSVSKAQVRMELSIWAMITNQIISDIVDAQKMLWLNKMMMVTHLTTAAKIITEQE